MDKKLRILILEDDLFDAELEVATLTDAGYSCQWERVETRANFLQCLENPSNYDLILADYNLPDFDGLTALNLLLERDLDIPFIIVSGAVGEEVAIESLKAGATDYVLKDRLTRLGVVVERAIKERDERMARRRAEEEALLANQRHQELVNTLDSVFWEADAKTLQFTFVSQQAEKLLGYPRQLWLDEPTFLLDHIHPDDVEFVVSYCTAQTEALRDHDLEYRLIAADGRTVWIHDIVTVIGQNNRPSKMRGIFVDITKRKLAEQALDEERNLLRTFIDNVPDYVYVKDRDSRFRLCNNAHVDLLGKTSPDEIIGRTDFDFYPDHFAQKYFNDEQSLMATGTPLINKEETALDTFTGQTFTHLSTKVPLRDAQNKIIGLVGLSRDITERKQLEEQLLQAQKMEAVGQLTAGIAHDFNNILGPIIGYAELGMMGLDDDDKLYSNFQRIRNAGERAANLTRQILAFSRKQVLKNSSTGSQYGD